MTAEESSMSASWKRPWSLNEIISFSNNWSLAGDSGVCELLKRFSSDLITEVTQVNYNLSELQIESKQLNVVMENVSNDLCMLANDQFIENLVEEVHDSSYGKVSHDVINQSKEDKGAQTVSLVMQALRMGLQVLENQFEVIDVTRMGSVSHTENDFDSQTVHSQNDFPVNEPIYQPKDPYENRHLPHLIGTVDFIEDDTLGIGYIDDIEEAPIMSEDESVSMTSESRPRQDLLTSSSDEEEEQSVRQEPPQSKKDDKRGRVSHVSDDDDDMFDTKSQSEDLFNDDLNNEQSEDLFYDDLDKKHSKVSNPPAEENEQESKPLTLTEQLNKQLKARLSIGAKPSEVLANIADDPVSVSKKGVNGRVDQVVNTKASANIIEQTPLESSMWSNDDDEDDDDIFALPSNKKSKGQISVVKIPQMVPDKVQTEEKDNSNNQVNKEPQKNVIQAPLSPEDSDSGDGLFGTDKPGIQKQAKIIAPIAKSRRKTESMSSDDLFDHSSVKSRPLKNGSRNTMPAATMSSTSKSTTLSRSENKQSSIIKRPTTVINPFHLSSDDDDLDDLFKPMATKKNNDMKVTKSPLKTSEASMKNNDMKVTNSPLKTSEASVKNNDVSVNDQLKVTVKASVKTNPDRKSDSSDSDSIFGSSPIKKTTMNSNGKVEQTQSDKKVENTQLEKKIEKRESINHFKDSDDSSDDIFSDKNATNKIRSSGISKKTDSPIIQKKTDSPIIQKKTDSPIIQKKTDSSIIQKKADSPIIQKKTESPIIPKKVTGLDPLSVDLDNSSRVDDIRRSQSPAMRQMDDDIGNEVTRPSLHVLAHNLGEHGLNNNNNIDSSITTNSVITDSISKQRPSQRIHLPPGAVSIFGGQSQSNKNNSLMDEMAERLSKSTLRGNIVSDDDNDGDGDDNDDKQTQKVPVMKTVIVEDNVPEHRSVQIPNMYRAKQGSPGDQDEKEINLETPALIVKPLNNLTKSRARVNNRRRPNNKKTDDTNNEDVPVVEPVAPNMERNMKMDESMKDNNSTPVMVALQGGDTEAQIVSNDNDDIFANLPLPEKKTTKTKKKESAKSRVSVRPTKEVDVTEIDDIFAIPVTKKTASSATGKKKSKSKSVVDDPLAPT